MGTVILGSGIAGISAGYHLEKSGEPAVIYEKNNDWGGLCGNFSIKGFRFDKFVHFSFAPDKYTADIFKESCEKIEHIPFPSNYYKGIWLRHPAQNNLAPLSSDEKTDVIYDFVNRTEKPVEEIQDYGEWLRVQYGDYFAENFPYKYTRKYWGVEPEELETKWVGQRMYTPDLKQVLKGAFETQDECFYYSKVMKYPKNGGFRSILNKCRKDLDIRFNKEVVKINPQEKTVTFKDGTSAKYSRLISTLPLPEIIKMLDNVPQDVKSAAENLMFTSGYMVSLGFNRPDVAKYLWFYIYDEDILTARVYSPNLKSPDNVPEGCSSLQAEIFFANRGGADIDITPRTRNAIGKTANSTGALALRERDGERGQNPLSGEEILEHTIEKLVGMGLFKKDDIVVKDIRFEKYANIIFDKDIYKNRKIVLDYIEGTGIESIGRFGRWEYFWTHQAFEDGRKVCNTPVNLRGENL